ncbi:efflux transporter periplasmic adaptor subunit [Photobacterium aquimaris]|uniref:Efflux RND transporter periplasmic adaptor subunit n=1 Tax=Photobacterium aquimaris TaxID=512643 RepID=A0A2T3IHK3_9GAMM|nr:efflux RND transporter periplasmic adaptor subunit [Photobacterium aquimaris]OBU15339.1 efflux transporter periplasmic adaptor subunit [Photobacterium aquimaris]OBU19009.1 efflux transporter periplasmic adaptor subunit [Photobacterium aquimaris]PSU27125.1 efflux RND transporter periplasmic adaptor subunit [Photobacterium aquimaris]PSV98498.1 efflux RND transporter periplasmic adaptor subunit [Photobacterium aquimaris]
MSSKNTVKIATVALLIGTAIGVTATHYISSNSTSMTAVATTAINKEPLYWVAPMDPNYRRDKPGKSPMGMDLIPVYAEKNTAEENIAGTVIINAALENNLGVKTAAVIKQKLSPQIKTTGYVAFDESHLWQTNIRVSGWVQQMYVNSVGEQVHKGDVLFTLYSPELVKSQQELLNAYRTGRSGLMRGARERLAALGVDKQQIEHIIKTGKATKTIEVKAITDGVIASLNIREGGYLSPAQAAISAGPLNEVWVNAEIFERQAHWITTGNKASMTLDAIPGQQWQGKVDYVYPILDPKTRTLRMRLKFANHNGQLKPNMFANITLTPKTETAVLTIPTQAVIRSGDMTRVVLAEGNGKYRSVKINIGREADDLVEVVAGLTTADRIVTSAQFMLDSESSKSADLSRINGVDSVDKSATVTWAQGEITAINADQTILTINHQPVNAWNWPAMTMDFNLDKNFKIKGLAVGQQIEFEIKKTANGQYSIIDYKQQTHSIANEVWVNGNISMLMAAFNMITINYQAVPEWQWPAGEMNFTVDDTIELTNFKQGQSIRFKLVKNGSDYILQDLKPMENK